MEALLSTGRSYARIAARGAEIVEWRVGNHDLIWRPDVAFWPRTAPILFPVVGWLRDGHFRHRGALYALPVHGFAPDETFVHEAATPSRVTFALHDTASTRSQWPFAFRLGVTFQLTDAALETRIQVTNLSLEPMPYACGVHPGFRWPFAGGDKADYCIRFAKPERTAIPAITAKGLFSSRLRDVAMQGRTLPLSDDIMGREALCFLDSASQSMDFCAPSGHVIQVAADGLPHLALWSRAGAPFLCMEAWTGHGDAEDATGDLSSKPSMRLLAPGDDAIHSATFSFREG